MVLRSRKCGATVRLEVDSDAALGGWCPLVPRREPVPCRSHSSRVFTATVAAMYYSYYMLPDGTYCLAPPPPGVDVATYYSTLPAAVAVSSPAGVTATAPPPPGTTPPPPPTTAETSSAATSTTITTRCAPTRVSGAPVGGGGLCHPGDLERLLSECS